MIYAHVQCRQPKKVSKRFQKAGLCPSRSYYNRPQSLCTSIEQTKKIRKIIRSCGLRNVEAMSKIISQKWENILIKSLNKNLILSGLKVIIQVTFQHSPTVQTVFLQVADILSCADFCMGSLQPVYV